MNRLGFIVLSVLTDNEAYGGISAMSAYEIADVINTVYKPDSIYRKLAEFEKSELVKCGFKDGKAKTFYLTEKGRKLFEEAKRTGENR